MSGSLNLVWADIAVQLGGRPVRLKLGVPAGPATLQDLLPALRRLTDANVDAGEARSTEAGKPVTCRKGCGACCRQLVPIAPAEAHRLNDVVERMPEPRRGQVRARFASGLARLAAGGVLDRLRASMMPDDASRRALGMDYFRQGVACPFLEDEACSIYEERPLACREYLVTSPPAHCSHPTAESVQCVPMPVRVSQTLGLMQTTREGADTAWVPLILSLEWAADHAQAKPGASGPELLEAVFSQLSGSLPEPSTTS